ncbi:MAG: hypothetical protein DMG78_25620 [Acidobacteria bacterium]|nr:MAG: hypothetical protein DMG78_25620 [Acidobacteriota bacterium]
MPEGAKKIVEIRLIYSGPGRTGETPIPTAAGDGGATISTAIFLDCGSIIGCSGGGSVTLPT